MAVIIAHASQNQSLRTYVMQSGKTHHIVKFDIQVLRTY